MNELKENSQKKVFQFRLHPKQLEIYHDNHRFKIAQCGRRFGKTQLAWIIALMFMLEHPKCLLWWVVPIYKELAAATKTVRDITPKEFITKKLESSETIRYLRLFNDAQIFFHSADKEDSLRGSGLHGLIVDEAPILKKNRWEAELKPSLMDYNGWALFIGTPKGKTWLTELFQKGQDKNNIEYKSWLRSSYDNADVNGGFIPKAYIDAIADDMPELLRRQEIDAETLEGEGIVFRHITDRIRKDIKPYQLGEIIVVGSDLAKHVDYYCNIGLRLNGDVVAFERYNKLDWPFMRKRSINFCEQLGGAYLLIDSTGVGDPVYDEITREYMKVEGYKLTNPTKKALIENLSIMLDNDEIHFPGDPEKKEFATESPWGLDFSTLKSELESFAYELSPSGLISYNAPEGLHDDCVIALALAAWQLKNQPGPIEVSFGRRPR